MVVGCPKCKAKLKVPDEKIRPEGSKFRCPKCRAMLLVRQPARKAEAPPPPKPKEMEPLSPWPERELDATAAPGEKRTESGPFPETTWEPSAFGWEPSKQEPPPPLEEPPPPVEEPPPPSMETAPEAPAPPEAPLEEEIEEKAEEKAAWEPAPEASPEAEFRAGRILIAHPDPETVNMLRFVLMGADYEVLSANDGVEAMVKALKELPEAIVVDVRLPKIHGVEVMKRLNARPETKGIKIILTSTKAEEEVPPIKGAAGYIQQDRLQQGLVDVLRRALAETEEAPAAAREEERAEPMAPAREEAKAEPASPARALPATPADAGVQRAQRFSRTVIADIELYNKDKVEQSVRQGSFETVFAKEIREGRKLYEMRIPQEVREKGDFYEEAVHNFLEKKRKQLGI